MAKKMKCTTYGSNMEKYAKIYAWLKERNVDVKIDNGAHWPSMSYELTPKQIRKMDEELDGIVKPNVVC